MDDNNIERSDKVMSDRFINLIGERFTRWVVVSWHHKDSYGAHYWECLCDCGNISFVPTYNLRKGKSRSCGCLERELKKISSKTHGLSDTSQNKAWRAAKSRCNNPEDESWGNYGGRGISMCEEWENSFEAFWRDMGDTWEEGLTLDRVDVNGNYCKENCRWATDSVQNHNRRKGKGKTSSYFGVSYDKKRGKFVASITKDRKCEHIGRFYKELDAAAAYDNRSEELYGDRPNKTERAKKTLDKSE